MPQSEQQLLADLDAVFVTVQLIDSLEKAAQELGWTRQAKAGPDATYNITLQKGSRRLLLVTGVMKLDPEGWMNATLIKHCEQPNQEMHLFQLNIEKKQFRYRLPGTVYTG